MRNHIDSKEKRQDLSSGSQNKQKQGIDERSLIWDTKMIDPKRQKEQGTEGSGETEGGNTHKGLRMELWKDL